MVLHSRSTINHAKGNNSDIDWVNEGGKSRTTSVAILLSKTCWSQNTTSNIYKCQLITTVAAVAKSAQRMDQNRSRKAYFSSVKHTFSFENHLVTHFPTMA